MNTTSRGALVRRGRRLAWLTIGWNTIEGVVALASGAVAGSIALVGFGVDSFVEVVAGGIIVWRLSKERHGEEVSAAAERRAVKLIAALSSSSPWASRSSRCASSQPERTPMPAPRDRGHQRVAGGHATLGELKTQCGHCEGEPVGTSRRNRNHAVRLAVRDRPRRPRLQRRVHLVVGRPARSPWHRLHRGSRGHRLQRIGTTRRLLLIDRLLRRADIRCRHRCARPL
jgi:hypothetical protein